MGATVFNTGRMEIAHIESRLVPKPRLEPGTLVAQAAQHAPNVYEHVLTLRVADGAYSKLRLREVRITVEGAWAGDVTQTDLARLMLDVLTETIQRQQADIRGAR